MNLVDRIPSEILFLFSSVFIVVFIFGLGSVWEGYDGGDFVSLLFLSCGIVFLGVAILLIFYLSFIRRIRAGVLWRHSIMRWFTN